MPAKLHPMPLIDRDSPLRAAGLVHESEVKEMFGYSPSTWARHHRLSIPGRTLPNGRWYHVDDVVAYVRSAETEKGDRR